MGIDPGLASTGMAIVEKRGTELTLKILAMVETKKATKKELRSTRVSGDDQRRIREYWNIGLQLVQQHNVQTIGVESYAPIPGQAGGGSWKTAQVYQAMICLGWSTGTFVVPFRPGDIKSRFLGKNSGTKIEVQTVIESIVPGMSATMDRYKQGKHEHLSDAVGHAILAVEEFDRIRKLLA